MGYRITDETPYQDPHSRGTGSIVTQRKGYILRTRGEHNRLVRHDFDCPLHGVFEARVPSGDVPTEMPCSVMLWCVVNGEVTDRQVSCGEPSPYRVPVVGQGLASGSVKC